MRMKLNSKVVFMVRFKVKEFFLGYWFAIRFYPVDPVRGLSFLELLAKTSMYQRLIKNFLSTKMRAESQ